MHSNLGALGVIAAASTAATTSDPATIIQVCVEDESGATVQSVKSTARGEYNIVCSADPATENRQPLLRSEELHANQAAAECIVRACQCHGEPPHLSTTHFAVNSNIISRTTVSLEKVVQHKTALLERGPGRELERMGSGTSIHLFLYVQVARKSFYVGMSAETVSESEVGSEVGNPLEMPVLRQDGSNLLALQPITAIKGEVGGEKRSALPTAAKVLTALGNNLRYMAAIAGINSIRASVKGEEMTIFLCSITVRRCPDGAYVLEPAHVGRDAKLVSIQELLQTRGADQVVAQGYDGQDGAERVEISGHSSTTSAGLGNLNARAARPMRNNLKREREHWQVRLLVVMCLIRFIQGT
jgi:hypothetical protein